MSEGDRALDAWLAEHVFGWQRRTLYEREIDPAFFTGEAERMYKVVGQAEYLVPPGTPENVEIGVRKIIGELRIGGQLPDLTGRDWSQLAEALRAKPYECVVSVTWVPAGSDEPAVCKASIIGDGIATAYFSAGDADTPGLALGRAAEHALGGES